MNESRESILEDMLKAKWYHTMELSPGHVTKGVFDWRPYFNDFHLGDLKGKKILDVGAGNGFFSFEMEKLGGIVTALDIPSQAQRDNHKIGVKAIREEASYNFANPFYIAKELLNSKVNRIEMDLYDLSPDTIGMFDIVFCNDVFLHLSDPFRALWAFRSICMESMIIGTPIYYMFAGLRNWQRRIGLSLLRNECVSNFLGDITDAGAFWIPNKTCLKAMVTGVGFDVNAFYIIKLNRKDNECILPRGIVHASVK